MEMLPSKKFGNFQLVSRQVNLARGSNIRTRAWVIEMSRSDAKLHFGEIIKVCNFKAAIRVVLPLMDDPTLWDKQPRSSRRLLSWTEPIFTGERDPES